MKFIALTLALALAGAAVLRADEVALVQVKVGKEKQLRLFAIEFYESDAPRTVENFKKLARKGFYNGTAIHRSFAGTLVQMGDPLSRKKERSKVGTGGPGYTIAPEIRRKHTRGAVAAARLPDRINPSRVSSGSQFFISLRALPEYDGQYTVFGNVLWGIETIDALSERTTDSNDNPAERLEIRSIKIMDRSKLPEPPKPVEPAPKPQRRWWQFFG